MPDGGFGSFACDPSGFVLRPCSRSRRCPRQANDSTAELAAGGLKFLADPDIAMRSEDLFISPSAVHVSYEFFNAANADKTALVAFPMPDITGSYDFTVSIPSDDLDNPFKFSVKSDGVERS